jgi:RNA polymerase sigma-70 factor (ECF subfamily)
MVVPVSAEANDAQVTRWALAAGAGDRDAATAFIQATQHQVWRFLHHLAGPREVEDLTQETFLRALRSLPGFAGRSSARTWLFTIARRVAVDHVRATMSRPRTANVDDWQDAADTANVDRARFDDDVVMRHLLDDLTDERREAFIATQVLGLSYAEAAEVCACPVGTIRSRVARAREDLTEAMDDGGHGRPGRRTAG